jgi:hypothetical protein
MIVKVLGQGLGAAAVAPKSGSGQRPSGRAATARVDSDPRPAPTRESGSAASQQLFDANGDGTIENWSFLHGGDSFATFDPPPPGTDTTRPSRSAVARREVADRLSSAHGPSSGTPAAVHHARNAYRRDGLGGAPVAHDVSTRGDTPVPTAPPVPVPQHGGSAALPSSR